MSIKLYRFTSNYQTRQSSPIKARRVVAFDIIPALSLVWSMQLPSRLKTLKKASLLAFQNRISFQAAKEVRMSESPGSRTVITETLWSLPDAVPKVISSLAIFKQKEGVSAFVSRNWYLPSSTLFPSKWRTLDPPRMAMYSIWVFLMAGQLFEMSTSLAWPFLIALMASL